MVRLKAFFLLGICLLLSSNCATSPIGEQYRDEAVEVPFSEIAGSPTRYRGSTVVWGGEILEKTVFRDTTRFIILQTPLDDRDRPGDKTDSRGRFIAIADDYLDPSVYEEGKRVTLAGEITGTETLPLGTTQYTYPVVRVEQIHLWREVEPGPYGYYDPLDFRRGPYDPGWYPLGWGRRHPVP
jgi:outer membrane lipoprotein